MVYSNDFKGEKLSALGFGTMRLPIIEGGTGADIDMAKLDEMVDYAIESGVNYFDTAYMYHDFKSEAAIGKSLSRYPREKWNLATKYPGHEIHSVYDYEGTFREQLEKCGVDYFDYYLLHNVNNSSVSRYLDSGLGITEYFIGLKKSGRIRHLGFSCHGDTDCINAFLDKYGDEMEFCQIQLNYLDWSLQNAQAKYELLTKRGIPVWVMEPVRGGKLSKIEGAPADKLSALNPDVSQAAWALRFLQGLPNVKMVLSGMSNPEQMHENCATFSARNVLTEAEKQTLFEVADQLKNSVPCTACRYCCNGCPAEINIPGMIALYNDCNVHPSMNISIMLSSVPEDRMPSACIGCGQCRAVCPQGIDVPELMVKMSEKFAALPSWEKVCLQREEDAKK